MWPSTYLMFCIFVGMPAVWAGDAAQRGAQSANLRQVVRDPCAGTFVYRPQINGSRSHFFNIT